MAALLRCPAAAQARHLQQTTSTRYYGANLYECVVNAGLTTTKQMIDVRALLLPAWVVPGLPCMLCRLAAGSPPPARSCGAHQACVFAAARRHLCRAAPPFCTFPPYRSASTVPAQPACLRITLLRDRPRCFLFSAHTEPVLQSPAAKDALPASQPVQAAGPDVIKLFMNPSLAVTFLAPDNQNWLT